MQQGIIHRATHNNSNNEKMQQNLFKLRWCFWSVCLFASYKQQWTEQYNNAIMAWQHEHIKPTNQKVCCVASTVWCQELSFHCHPTTASDQTTIPVVLRFLFLFLFRSCTEFVGLLFWKHGHAIIQCCVLSKNQFLLKFHYTEILSFSCMRFAVKLAKFAINHSRNVLHSAFVVGNFRELERCVFFFSSSWIPKCVIRRQKM